MVFGLYLFRRYDSFDHPFFVNDEGGTKRTHILTTVHALFSPYSKLLYQLLVGIGYQGKRKLIFLDKLLVRFCIVNAYAYHLITCLPEFVIIIAQVTACAVQPEVMSFG